jgi:hypothetical protein
MDGFYATLVELVKLGSAGVGIAIFLMVFYLLARGKPVDKATASLREKFLKYGVGFAMFCGLLALLPSFFQKPSGPLAMRLSFSPDFESGKLTPPKVYLPDGSKTEPEKNFLLRPSSEPQVVTVKIDGTIEEVRALRDTSKKLAESVGTAQAQVGTLAAQVEAPAAEQKNLEANAAEVKSIQSQVTQSLQVGDYAKANVLSGRLRTSVRKSDRAVATIAQPQP